MTNILKPETLKTSTSLSGATLYHCPDAKCWIFPFATVEQVAEHVASGEHSYPLDPAPTPTPIPSKNDDARTVEAANYARTYSGDFGFMLEMRAKARRPVFRPSPKMVDAILRCKASDEARAATPAPADRYTGMTWAQVMEANEFFDGEPEVTAHHRARWEAANPAPVTAAAPTAPAPKATAPAQPANVRPNRYGGNCNRCGAYVAENAGTIDKVNGKWIVLHVGTCPEPTATPAQGDTYDPQRGDVHVLDGSYYRVHVGQQSGKPYACKAVVTSEAVWDNGTLSRAGEVDWQYDRSAIRRMSEATRATAAQSKAFGEMVGRCCFCSHKIDTPESVTAGYGPDCAERFGLPWGNR